MNELLKVDYGEENPTVDGRELHKALQIETPYNKWFQRMCEYGFVEGKDFNMDKNVRVGIEGVREVSREVIDHKLTIDMAKQLCMIQRTDIGRKFREYFIKVEEAWNDPQAILARALKVTQTKLDVVSNELIEVKKVNSALTVELEIARPKAEYFDVYIDRGMLTNLRDTAKELHVGEKKFIQFLLDKKYVYRDIKGALRPYAHYTDKENGEGYFHLKECYNNKTQWAGVQTLVTPRGRKAFSELKLIFE